MKEEMAFVTLRGRKLFIHSHVPKNINHKTILFLNPLFDEKKRVQRFQVETARALCELGYYIIRFDYCCTGDSLGFTHDFDFEETIEQINWLIEYAKSVSKAEELIILGVRIGADLALCSSTNEKIVTQLCLIEPIVSGNRYLLEQRMKRSAFYKLNRINYDTQVIIQDQVYEDFQGYLLSQKALKFLECLNSVNTNFTDKRIAIFRTQSKFNKKYMQGLVNSLTDSGNKVYLFQDNVPDFWMSLEPVNTDAISQRIISHLRK